MSFLNSPIIYLTRKLWKYAGTNRRSVVLYLFMFITANGIFFFEPLVIAYILNTIQVQGITATSMPFLLGALIFRILIEIVFWSFHGPARVIENKNAFIVRSNYKKYLLEGVMAFPMDWHSDHHSGDTIDKVEKGTAALYRYSGDTFQLIESVVKLISSYFALIYFDLSASYIVLFMVTITVIFILQFDKVLVRQYKEIYGAENKVSAKVFDVISNITTVIILRIEKLVASAIYKEILKPFKLFSRNNVVNEVKWSLVSLSSVLMTTWVLAAYFYSHLASGEVVLIGTVYALYGYITRITDLFFRFAYMYGDIVQQKAAVLNAEQIANEFSSLRKPKDIVLGSRWHNLSIKNLSFAYQTAKKGQLHLDDVSLTITRGKRIAVIGASGSGKTTFLKIIRELYQPTACQLELDGKLLPNGFKSISESIALIPQDPEIFSTSIRENITVGINHTDAYIRKFTDMACFTDVIKRLPHKLESSIFEKGVNLSGGEKQRLALARGLLASEDKEIILLDESTSSVDSKNELHIYRNIFKTFKAKTIIASIHRLHLLNLFDEIYFFQSGKIIASGTLKQLLKQSPEFQDIWEKYHKVTKEEF